MREPITDFRGPYRWLSNFHLAPVEFEGVVYPSTEHAYQVVKMLDPSQWLYFTKVTASTAKKLGQGLALRSDWEIVKFDVMEALVRQKFTTHPELKAKLLATGDAFLLEGNTWHDNIWGDCSCSRPSCSKVSGGNHLGKILMKVRAELKDA